MRTIRENLEEAIELLKTNFVQKHIEACHLVYLDLSHIEGFDPDAIALLAYYQGYLIEKHQSISKVGIMNKIKGFFKARGLRTKVLDLVNRCQTKNFGDGDKFIQEITGLIRKAI